MIQAMRKGWWGAAAGAALSIAAGCDRKAPLPPGLERVDPGAPIEALQQAAPQFHRFDPGGSVLITERGYLCFDFSGQAVGLGGGVMSLIYQRVAAEPGRRACYDQTLDRPPRGWSLLAQVKCADHREAYFTIDGRWAARMKDGPQVAELALLADADLRADARRAPSAGCAPIR